MTDYNETYIDCPYYEQLQYIMDTRSEILYTYAVSADDSLARKAIAEFSRAQRSDGLLNCSYPNKSINVIPCFALYYILMVHDHMMYFGDAELVQSVLPVIRRILDFFEERVIREGYAKCSVAMRFYLFRALEQTDLYEYTDGFWDIWRKMVRNHCTTSVEAEFYARSECHAWGALALYELPCVVLGVRPTAPGYSRIEVKPHSGYITSASGTVHTPAGDVKVSWRKVGEEIEVETEVFIL